MSRLKKLVASRWVLFGIGLVLGAGIILGIRLFTYDPPHVHYHANFGVYINGRREEFKNPKYYQEVAVCSTTDNITMPQQRAHLHDEVNSVIHVHDHAVTWGQLFENLGWIIGPDFIYTADGQTYKASGSKKLHLILNGQDYTDLTSMTNTVIKDRDRLLVSFGKVNDKELARQFKSVPNTAVHYDTSKDPASCSSGEPTSWSARLHHLF